MKELLNKKKDIARALVIILELFAVGIIAYLIILPFYPKIKYQISYNREEVRNDAKDLEKTKQKVQKIIQKQQAEEQKANKQENKSNNENNNNAAPAPVIGNRLIITKIGINAPIVESQDEDYGLARGSWHVPETSTPDQGSNTVITGHRFKYLPPNNVTFYLLDKLENDDIISVIWNDKEYYYKVRESKIVGRTETSILNSSDNPILTLFTCDPIYSEENRLVVVGELIE